MSNIKDILSRYKSIAMVGVSKDEKKTSTIVMKYMIEYGFKVYPVNPSAKGEKILGEDVFAKISDIKDQVDIVDVFRPSKEVYAIAEDAIKIGAKVLWLQLGIRDEKAKDLMEKEDDWSSMFTVFGGIVDVKNKENLLNKEEIKALD